MTKYILPRVTKANRGDLASRWGLIKTLELNKISDVVIFSRSPDDVPSTDYLILPYGYFKNLIPKIDSVKPILKSEVILWVGGLDIQDDASLVKVLYLGLFFFLSKVFGKKVILLLQGAGPINTRSGRFLTKNMLRFVDIFVARDPQSYQLIGDLKPDLRKELGFDAIFLPGFEDFLRPEKSRNGSFFSFPDENLVIGINIRQWFHFSSSLIPFQFNRKKYLRRSQLQMEILLQHYYELINWLIEKYQANILLISAYQPGIEPWEDDEYYLKIIKNKFAGMDKVKLMEEVDDLEDYFHTIGMLDFMIGMRLHSSLTALRLGVPSINISYTNKGQDILTQLDLSENIVNLTDFIESPDETKLKIEKLIQTLPEEKEKINSVIEIAIHKNFELIKRLIS